MKYLAFVFCLLFAACSQTDNAVSFVDPKPFPNPFDSTVTIPFNVTKAGDVDVIVYNLNGQTVKNLVSRKMEVGSYTTTWNGTNNKGIQVASGNYRYLVATADDRVSGVLSLAR